MENDEVGKRESSSCPLLKQNQTSPTAKPGGAEIGSREGRPDRNGQKAVAGAQLVTSGTHRGEGGAREWEGGMGLGCELGEAAGARAERRKGAKRRIGRWQIMEEKKKKKEERGLAMSLSLRERARGRNSQGSSCIEVSIRKNLTQLPGDQTGEKNPHPVHFEAGKGGSARDAEMSGKPWSPPGTEPARDSRLGRGQERGKFASECPLCCVERGVGSRRTHAALPRIPRRPPPAEGVPA